MKSLKYGLLIVLAMLVCQATGYGFQGSGGEELTKGPGPVKTPTPKPKDPGIKKPPPGGRPLHGPTPALAEVVVNTNLAECQIMLDGATKGRTNSSGMLKLTAVQPGAHVILVRRDGYHDEQRNVELVGGRSDAVNIALTRILPVAELVTNAETAYRNSRYGEAIAACREALASQPDHPRANLVLGEADYMTGQPESADLLWKALSLGEVVTLPIKHHHGGASSLIRGQLDDLCAGNLILRKGAVEFQSKEKSDENFSVPMDKVVEIKNEARKGGRLSLRIKVPKGAKESDKTYNFHAPAAVAGRPSVFCSEPSCAVTVDTLYTLLQKLKQ